MNNIRKNSSIEFVLNASKKNFKQLLRPKELQTCHQSTIDKLPSSLKMKLTRSVNMINLCPILKTNSRLKEKSPNSFKQEEHTLIRSSRPNGALTLVKKTMRTIQHCLLKNHSLVCIRSCRRRTLNLVFIGLNKIKILNIGPKECLIYVRMLRSHLQKVWRKQGDN